MKNSEYNFYQNVKNWDFSMIKRESELLTNWDMYDVLNENANEKSVVLDLGTGGGEKVLKYFPKVKEIVATDYSEEMINTAEKNLADSFRKSENIKFKVMDNMDMSVPENYFDIVVARHTIIDAVQIHKSLKDGGLLILRGVDKLDCWQLKRLFGRGQAYQDNKPISLIDYENILAAGFKDVELIPIHEREYYKSKDDLLALLHKTPILDNMSVDDNEYDRLEIDEIKLHEYITKNTYDKGILLIRRYYGITARK